MYVTGSTHTHTHTHTHIYTVYRCVCVCVCIYVIFFSGDKKSHKFGMTIPLKCTFCLSSVLSYTLVYNTVQFDIIKVVL